MLFYLSTWWWLSLWHLYSTTRSPVPSKKEGSTYGRIRGGPKSTPLLLNPTCCRKKSVAGSGGPSASAPNSTLISRSWPFIYFIHPLFTKTYSFFSKFYIHFWYYVHFVIVTFFFFWVFFCLTIYGG